MHSIWDKAECLNTVCFQISCTNPIPFCSHLIHSYLLFYGVWVLTQEGSENSVQPHNCFGNGPTCHWYPCMFWNSSLSVLFIRSFSFGHFPSACESVSILSLLEKGFKIGCSALQTSKLISNRERKSLNLSLLLWHQVLPLSKQSDIWSSVWNPSCSLNSRHAAAAAAAAFTAIGGGPNSQQYVRAISLKISPVFNAAWHLLCL